MEINDHSEPSHSDFLDTLTDYLERSPRNTLRYALGNLLSHGILEKTPEVIEEPQGKLLFDGSPVGRWLAKYTIKKS